MSMINISNKTNETKPTKGTKWLDAAPLIIGILVMGMTIACFVLKIIGVEGPLPALNVGMISGIVLLILMDYLPSLLAAIGKKQPTAEDVPPSPVGDDVVTKQVA